MPRSNENLWWEGIHSDPARSTACQDYILEKKLIRRLRSELPNCCSEGLEILEGKIIAAKHERLKKLFEKGSISSLVNSLLPSSQLEQLLYCNLYSIS